MDHKGIVKNRYDETVDHYDLRYKKIQIYKYELIFKKILIKPRQIILDVGCGTGNLFEFLKNLQSFNYGIDFSIESLKKLRNRFERNQLSGVICGDIDYFPFKRDYFDIILVITVLQNLPEPIKCLEGIKQICKPNGLIVLSLLNKKFRIERIKNLLKKLKWVPLEIINDPICEDTILILRNS
ncbi:MAG: class I SAM-dependent methyltransferase [Candidatus Helarchaeota archaeon]